MCVYFAFWSCLPQLYALWFAPASFQIKSFFSALGIIYLFIYLFLYLGWDLSLIHFGFFIIITWGYSPQVHGVCHAVWFVDIWTGYCKKSGKGTIIGKVQGSKGTLPMGAQLDLPEMRLQKGLPAEVMPESRNWPGHGRWKERRQYQAKGRARVPGWERAWSSFWQLQISTSWV